MEPINHTERAAKLRRLTKEMLPDPARRIDLDDLIAQEVSEMLKVLTDPDKFPLNKLEGSNAEQLVTLVDTAEKYWALVEPFCHSLYVAARWASAEQLDPWIRGIKVMVSNALKQANGYKVLADLRHIPLISSIIVAATACSANGRWENLTALLADQTVKNVFGRGETLDLLSMTSFYSPLQASNVAASALARRAEESESVEDAIKHYTDKRGGLRHTPVADWFFENMRPIFSEQFPDEGDYYHEFERAIIRAGLALGRGWVEVNKTAFV